MKNTRSFRLRAGSVAMIRAIVGVLLAASLASSVVGAPVSRDVAIRAATGWLRLGVGEFAPGMGRRMRGAEPLADAEGNTVGFDDDRSALFGYVSLGCYRVVEYCEFFPRAAVLPHQLI